MRSDNRQRIPWRFYGLVTELHTLHFRSGKQIKTEKRGRGGDLNSTKPIQKVKTRYKNQSFLIIPIKTDTPEFHPNRFGVVDRLDHCGEVPVRGASTHQVWSSECSAMYWVYTLYTPPMYTVYTCTVAQCSEANKCFGVFLIVLFQIKEAIIRLGCQKTFSNIIYCLPEKRSKLRKSVFNNLVANLVILVITFQT